VLSRQVKIILPPVSLRVPVLRPVLSPSAHVFCPRADRLPPTGTIHPSVNISKPPTVLRVPVVECDDTLLKTHVGHSHMFSMESTDLTVPSHLQGLFDKSVAQGDFAPSHQCMQPCRTPAPSQRRICNRSHGSGVLQRSGVRY